MFNKMTLNACADKLKREIQILVDTLAKTSATDKDYLTLTKSLNQLLEAYEKFTTLK